MGLSTGIIGLSKSGKTTLYNAMTSNKAATGSYSSKASANVGIASVPEPRLETLAGMFFPQKVVYAEAKFIDVGASLKNLVEEKKGIGGKLLNELSTVDALINVVRAFEDDSVPHDEGSIDVERDIAAMDLELAFSDLAIIERRLERIVTSLKSAKQAERSAYQKEQALLAKLKAVLENDVPIRELELTPDEEKAISSYQFLTEKPLLIVVNIGESQLDQAAQIETELNSKYGHPKRRIIAVSSKLEAELSLLSDEEAAEFRNDYGLTESSLDRLIQQSYELLGFISFFTVGADECRAWPITKGISAMKAAGKIHSDIERGFIRAEVVHYDDLIRCGNMAEAKKEGVLRLEGKEYPVKDGDIINFLFNV